MANIDIYGTLHNVTGEPVVTADQAKDNNLGKTQQELNTLFNQGKNAQGEQIGGSSYTSGDGIKADNFADKEIAVDFGDDQDTILTDIGISTSVDDTPPVGEDTSYELNCTSDQQYHLNISLVKRTLNGTDYKALKIIGNLFEHGAGVPWATYTGTVDGVAVSGTIQSYCEGESGSLTNIGYSNLGASDAVVSNIVITPVLSTKDYGFVVNNDGSRSFVSLQAYSA